MHAHLIDSLEPRRLFSALDSVFETASLLPISETESLEMHYSAKPLTPIEAAAAIGAPSVVNGIIHARGSSKNDGISVERNRSNDVPTTNRQVILLDSAGGLLKHLLNGQAPAPDNNLLNPGNYIHIHDGSTDIYILAAGIKGLNIQTGRGDDKVLIANNLKLPATISGGGGDDTLVGGLRSDSISGGAGDDYVAGGKCSGGNDTLSGGEGTDTVIGFAGHFSFPDLSDGAVDRITATSDSDSAEPALTSIVHYKTPGSGWTQEDIFDQLKI